jgi:hypothetical protein
MIANDKQTSHEQNKQREIFAASMPKLLPPLARQDQPATVMNITKPQIEARQEFFCCAKEHPSDRCGETLTSNGKAGSGVEIAEEFGGFGVC